LSGRADDARAASRAEQQRIPARTVLFNRASFGRWGRVWPEYGHGQRPNTIRCVSFCVTTETPMIKRISRESAVL